MDPVETLATLNTAVKELETALSPILAVPLVELLASGKDSLEKAKLDVTLAYVVHDLIWSTFHTPPRSLRSISTEIGSNPELRRIVVVGRWLMLIGSHSLSEDSRRRSSYSSRHGRTRKSNSSHLTSHLPLTLANPTLPRQQGRVKEYFDKLKSAETKSARQSPSHSSSSPLPASNQVLTE